MGDVYAELSKLKQLVEELKPQAAEAQENAIARYRAEDDAKEWKRLGSEAVQAKVAGDKQLEAEQIKLAEVTRSLEAKAAECADLEKKLETLKLNAKFDAQARDGQVKRARIIQVELEETRGENERLEGRNIELENANEQIVKSVNHERALRLQELHRNLSMGKAKKVLTA